MPGKNNGRGGGRMAPRAEAAREYRHAVERGNNTPFAVVSEREHARADALDAHYGFSPAEKGVEE